MVIVQIGKNSATYPEHALAEICLEAAGGGYSEAQTRKAMQAQAAILACGKAKVGRFTIILEKE